jgi:hypothetical protein
MKQLIIAQAYVISKRINLLILIEIKSGYFLAIIIIIKNAKRGRIFKINPKFTTSNKQD